MVAFRFFVALTLPLLAMASVIPGQNKVAPAKRDLSNIVTAVQNLASDITTELEAVAAGAETPTDALENIVGDIITTISSMTSIVPTKREISYATDKRQLGSLSNITVALTTIVSGIISLVTQLPSEGSDPTAILAQLVVYVTLFAAVLSTAVPGFSALTTVLGPVLSAITGITGGSLPLGSA